MKGPSNKVAAFFVLLVLIVAGIIAFSARDSKKVASDGTVQPTILALQQNPDSNPIDSDGDGLLDWEETLRLSNPTNPDTDGDGTIDGDEIRDGRDPTVAGPDDQLEVVAAAKLAAIEPIYANYKEGTLTEQLASNFLLNYAQYGGDASYAANIEPQLIEQLATDVDSLTDIDNTYTTRDILTFAFDYNKAHTYGNSFAEIQRTLLERLMATQNNEPTTYLDRLSEIYADTALDLTNIPVPYELSALHIEVVNNFARVGKVIYEINHSNETDPVRALFAIKDYNEAAELQLEIYTRIATYFKDNGIIFESNEPGNFWNNI